MSTSTHMDNVNSQRRKVGKAVSFSTLAANASLEEWRLDADIDESCIRPIAEAFDANPSIPLAIIKDVREQDFDLAENLFKMSEFNPGAKAEFYYQNETGLYDLVMFELHTTLHERTIGLVLFPISNFLRGKQWIYGEHNFIHDCRSATWQGKLPDGSFYLIPHTYKSVPLLMVEVACAQTLEHVLTKVNDFLLKPKPGVMLPKSVLVVKAYKQVGDATNRPADFVPGLVMLWFTRRAGVDQGPSLVKHALFGKVPAADAIRLAEIDGITRITVPVNQDMTFDHEEESWTIDAKTDLFGFHEDQDYVQLFNKYASVSLATTDPNTKNEMKRVCFMLKRQVYEAEPTFEIDVNDIWRKYQGIYNDWKDNLMRSCNPAAKANAAAALLIAAAATENNQEIVVDYSDEEE